MTDLQLVETVTITEKAAQTAAATGEFPIQFISPGWGSSGYYSPETLVEAARDRVIPAGTHMYADHPTDDEARSRPGRSVKDLMAVTTEDAHLSESGALVGRARVVPSWQPFVEAVRNHIGVSIRGDAKDVRDGVAEGRRGRIIEGLAHVASVDFVTRAGRGGRVLELLESAVTDGTDIREDLAKAVEESPSLPAPTHVPADRPDGSTTTDSQENHMGQKTIEESEYNRLVEDAGRVTTLEADLAKAKADLAEATKTPEGDPAPAGPAAQPAATAASGSRALFEAEVAKRDHQIARLVAADGARLIVAECLAEAWLTDGQKARIATEVMGDLPMKDDDTLDEAALREAATARANQAEEEANEVLKSNGFGDIKGLGTGAMPVQLGEAAVGQIEAELTEMYQERGLSESAAKTAAKGR